MGAWTELCILLYDNYEVLFDAKKRSSATSGAIASLGAEAVWYNDFDSTYLLVMSKCFATDLSAAWSAGENSSPSSPRGWMARRFVNSVL